MKIGIAVSGEGKGHASRMAALAEKLQHQFDIVWWAPVTVQEFLISIFPDSKIRDLPYLKLVKTNHKVKPLSTLLSNMGTIIKSPVSIRNLKQEIKNENLIAVISDYEPFLSKAALKLRVPCITFNHQAVIDKFPLSSVSQLLSKVTNKLMIPSRKSMIISSFFEGDVGPMVRQSVAQAKVGKQDYIFVYLKPSFRSKILPVLSCFTNESFRFYPSDDEDFVTGLANCKAIIAPAGHQLICDSLVLNKPILAFPENNQFEQQLNAKMLTQSGRGYEGSITHPKEKQTFESKILLLQKMQQSFRCFVPVFYMLESPSVAKPAGVEKNQSEFSGMKLRDMIRHIEKMAERENGLNSVEPGPHIMGDSFNMGLKVTIPKFTEVDTDQFHAGPVVTHNKKGAIYNPSVAQMLMYCSKNYSKLGPINLDYGGSCDAKYSLVFCHDKNIRVHSDTIPFAEEMQELLETDKALLQSYCNKLIEATWMIAAITDCIGRSSYRVLAHLMEIPSKPMFEAFLNVSKQLGFDKKYLEHCSDNLHPVKVAVRLNNNRLITKTLSRFGLPQSANSRADKALYLMLAKNSLNGMWELEKARYREQALPFDIPNPRECVGLPKMEDFVCEIDDPYEADLLVLFGALLDRSYLSHVYRIMPWECSVDWIRYMSEVIDRTVVDPRVINLLNSERNNPLALGFHNLFRIYPTIVDEAGRVKFLNTARQLLIAVDNVNDWSQRVRYREEDPKSLFSNVVRLLCLIDDIDPESDNGKDQKRLILAEAIRFLTFQNRLDFGQECTGDELIWFLGKGPQRENIILDNLIRLAHLPNRLGVLMDAITFIMDNFAERPSKHFKSVIYTLLSDVSDLRRGGNVERNHIHGRFPELQQSLESEKDSLLWLWWPNRNPPAEFAEVNQLNLGKMYEFFFDDALLEPSLAHCRWLVDDWLRVPNNKQKLIDSIKGLSKDRKANFKTMVGMKNSSSVDILKDAFAKNKVREVFMKLLICSQHDDYNHCLELWQENVEKTRHAALEAERLQADGEEDLAVLPLGGGAVHVLPAPGDQGVDLNGEAGQPAAFGGED